MKKIPYILSLVLALTFVVSCSTQNTLPSPIVKQLVEKGQFTFMAQHANPTGLDVINVMNSLPNSSAGRITNLDPGYTIELMSDELRVTLPYFGRMYQSTMQSDNSYRFISKDFALDRTEGKKGSSVFVLKPRDEKNISRIIIEVFRNGKSYVSIDANDRQPISYDGYITENTTPKK